MLTISKAQFLFKKTKKTPTGNQANNSGMYPDLLVLMLVLNHRAIVAGLLFLLLKLNKILILVFSSHSIILYISWNIYTLFGLLPGGKYLGMEGVTCLQQPKHKQIVEEKIVRNCQSSLLFIHRTQHDFQLGTQSTHLKTAFSNLSYNKMQAK